MYVVLSGSVSVHYSAEKNLTPSSDLRWFWNMMPGASCAALCRLVPP